MLPSMCIARFITLTIESAIIVKSEKPCNISNAECDLGIETVYNPKIESLHILLN